MNEKIDPISGLTDDELMVSRLLIEAWNMWLGLFVRNGHATEEEKLRFREGMHMIQQILADRALHRAYPEYWK